jgi:hypothetical protein
MPAASNTRYMCCGEVPDDTLVWMEDFCTCKK